MVQNPGNFPGSGPKVVETERFAKVQAAQSIHCLTVQQYNERCPGSDDSRRCMKDSRFCQFQNDKDLTESYVRCIEDERGHSKRDKGGQAPQWQPRDLCVEEFRRDSKPLRREKRRVDTRVQKKETTRDC